MLGGIALVLFVASTLIGIGFIALWKDRGALIFSAIVWVISIIAFVYSLYQPSATPFAIYADKPVLDASFIWYFLPASVAGFLLCPYLDATFVRARIKTSRVTGILAFKIGFLVFFASMIVFTTAYGHELLGAFAGEESRLEGIWWTILLVHIPLQMGLTTAWHGREILECSCSWLKARSTEPRHSVTAGLMWSIAGCAVVFVAVFFMGVLFRHMSVEAAHEVGRHMSLGEIGYRCILIFYGTLFPAYVIVMMVPTFHPRGDEKPWGLFAVTVVLASITGYLGFIHDLGWAITATLTIVSVARLVVDTRAMLNHKRSS